STLDDPHQRQRWLRAAAVGFLLFSCLQLGWALVAMLLCAAISEVGRRWRLGPALIAVSVVLLFSADDKFGLTTPLLSRPEAARRDIAEYARRQTPPGALFLVDPSWGDFRSLAERQAFVTWKEGAAILWQRSYVRTWTERL